MKVSNYQCFFRELKSPVGKRQTDFPVRRIQSLTRTCPVIAQVFFKFPTRRRFHHENIFIVSGIFPFQNKAWYNTEEKSKCISKKYCGYIYGSSCYDGRAPNPLSTHIDTLWQVQNNSSLRNFALAANYCYCFDMCRRCSSLKSLLLG